MKNIMLLKRYTNNKDNIQLLKKFFLSSVFMASMFTSNVFALDVRRPKITGVEIMRLLTTPIVFLIIYVAFIALTHKNKDKKIRKIIKYILLICLIIVTIYYGRIVIYEIYRNFNYDNMVD